MPAASIDLKQALDLARTGDVWLFRGYSVADRAIRVATTARSTMWACRWSSMTCRR